MTPRGGEFNEVLREGAQISGVVILGALRHGTGSPPSLMVDLHPDWVEDEMICARVMSADGLYEAENAYPLPSDWTDGRAVLDFPTEHDGLLSSLPRGGVAVWVEAGDCTRPSNSGALTLWNDGGDAPPILLVNAFAADEVFLYVQDAAILCEPLPLAGLSAYGHACELPEGLSGDVELTLYRIKGGKAPDPTRTRLWLGSL